MAEATAAASNTSSRPSLSSPSGCLICVSEWSHPTTHRTIVPCHHNDICAQCHLRLRYLRNDTACPMCKTNVDQCIVVADNFDYKHFDEYPVWGNDLGADYAYHESVAMFFPIGIYQQEILPLFGYACGQCDFDPATTTTTSTTSTGKKGKNHTSPLRQLQDHLRTVHGTTLCRLCIDHKRDFVARLPRYIPRLLQQHLKKGVPGEQAADGFAGHPLCVFCKKRFYSLEELHGHLQKDHYRCHLCDKQREQEPLTSRSNNQRQQQPHSEYYKDYSSLEKHFDQQHFLCHDVQCLAARFVVFANELDWRAHEVSVHGATSSSNGSTKIQLAFRHAGPRTAQVDQEERSDYESYYAVQGQAFAVPDVASSSSTVPDHNNNNNNVNASLHPAHVQRTAELRAQAAQWREKHARQEAASQAAQAFPSLASANQTEDTDGAPLAASSSAPLRTGWTSSGSNNIRPKAVGKVTEQDFPSLGPSSSKGRKQQRQQFGIASSKKKTAPTAAYGRLTSSHMSQNAKPKAATAMPALTYASAPSPQSLAEQFPALGVSSSSSATTATPNYGRFAQAASAPRSTKSTSTAKRPPAAPSTNSLQDFPAMAPAAPTLAQSARHKILYGTPSGTSAAQAQNVLQVPNAAAASHPPSILEIKGALGPKRYKELRQMIVDFTQSKLSPEGLVDQSAALFDQGYADADFWRFLPALLQDCPNEGATMHALQYMTSLKSQQQQYTNPPAAATNVVAHKPLSWGSGAGRPNLAPAARVSTQRPIRQQASSSTSTSSSAWASGAPPLSAAQVQQQRQVPNVQTAASNGSKTTKKNNNNNSKKKGKKQKDELRALAFGS